MKDLEYDLVAIGGGTAGLVTAAGAALLGTRPALVESVALGGDCLWTGCVPSKALIASAKLAHGMRHADRLGLTGAAPQHVFATVMERMRTARATVAHHDDPERFRAMGVAVVEGYARFTEPGRIEVEGVGGIRSKRFVIATGASAFVPPIPGLEEVGFLTNHTAFDQTELPGRVVILGGGPIGLEFSQVYARLGASVTVLEMAPDVLPKEDADVSELMRGLLADEGIRVETGTRVVRFERDGADKVAIAEDGRRFPADEILVATGRRPNTDDLGLDAAGVELDGAAVKVDRHLATTAKGVWAAGDVTGGLQFTHVAEYMASTALRNALLPVKAAVNYDNVPWVTFTDPEVAHVGLGQQEAEARGARTYWYEFSDLDRAIADGETKGMVKISADAKGRILGATIVGTSAGELLFPLVMAKTHGIPLSKVASTIFPYPTKVEGLKRAANEFQRARLEGRGGRILKRVISWLT